MAIRARSRWFIPVAIALGMAPALSPAQAPAQDCPQPRFTGKAPDDYHNRANPLPPTDAGVEAGDATYHGDPRRISCASCHGEKGDGQGRLTYQFDPPPRNFTCAQTIRGVPDGQLFWIIRYGSPGTSMPPHKRLTDEQIWQLVLYLRRLAG